MLNICLLFIILSSSLFAKVDYSMCEVFIDLNFGKYVKFDTGKFKQSKEVYFYEKDVLNNNEITHIFRGAQEKKSKIFDTYIKVHRDGPSFYIETKYSTVDARDNQWKAAFSTIFPQIYKFFFRENRKIESKIPVIKNTNYYFKVKNNICYVDQIISETTQGFRGKNTKFESAVNSQLCMELYQAFGEGKNIEIEINQKKKNDLKNIFKHYPHILKLNQKGPLESNLFQSQPESIQLVLLANKELTKCDDAGLSNFMKSENLWKDNPAEPEPVVRPSSSRK